MTKSIPFRFLKLYAFWMLFFAATRLIFLAYNFSDTGNSGFGEILGAFFHGLYVDTAMASYLMALPFLLFALMFFWPSEWPDRINRWFHLLLIFCTAIITCADLPIYDEWGHKLTYKALWFMRNPAEVMDTATWQQLVFGLAGIFLLTWGGCWLFKKILGRMELPEKRNWITASAFLLLTPALLFTGLRGGWQPIPIQVSDAYFSQNNFLNHVAVNSDFHLLSSIAQRQLNSNYTYIPQDEAERIFAGMHRTEKDSTIRVLDTLRPNVMLVVLEGWSADLVEALGGYPGITPNMDRIAREGISFDSCFASGSLSDQGLAAVFSAFPAQPHTSIITQPEKYSHLPCLSKDFEKAGYSTSFIYGAQLTYGNARAYMYYNGFDRITEWKDFDASVPHGRLGLHDEYVFDRQLSILKETKEPFFAGLFTLSTHGPFDIPMKMKKLDWAGDESDYVNSVHYADSCIGRFLAAAKKEPWYKNTLFVFVSDHSHNTPKRYPFANPEFRRIAMMLYGEPVKAGYRGYHYKKICSQTDLASTLLHQLGLDASAYHYSQNLFNPYTQPFAFYSHQFGIGYIDPAGTAVLYIGENKWVHELAKNPADLPLLRKKGQAYLQVMFGEYLKF